MNVLNDTPLPHQVFLWRDQAAHRQCSIIVKASLELSSGRLAAVQDPLVPADQLAPNRTVQRPADLAPFRTGTNVVFRASIYAPRGTLLPEVRARVRVGPLSKRIVAFGRRTWTDRAGVLTPSSPEPFESVPATLEHAFGGGPPGTWEANPAGLGFLGSDEPADGRPLPFLEDADALIRGPRDMPAPASLDAIPATFAPRPERAGTRDRRWQRMRAPLLPLDFDDRYFDVAQESLVARPFLRGREPIELEGLHPDGAIVTSLPRVHVRIDAGGARELPFLDLVVIDPATDRITLTFRRTFDLTPFGMSPPKARVFMLERAAEAGKHV